MEKEYVIKNNAIVLKCAIPSFVADFVSVESWIDDSGTEFTVADEFSESKLKNTSLDLKSPFPKFLLFYEPYYLYGYD